MSYLPIEPLEGRRERVTSYEEYVVSGAFPVQDAETNDPVAPGGTVKLGASQGEALESAGLVSRDKQEPEKKACPLCAEQGSKRPAKLGDAAELAEHYSAKHPGFQPPEWEEV
jgi:hypothetical protein